MDTSAGRSTEARGLPRAFPAYDPRDTLAWLCQKHRSCRPDRPSLCSGGMSSPGDETHCSAMWWDSMTTRQLTAHITGRSSKNRLPFWSWLAAFMDPADRWRYTLQHSCWMVQGSSLWPLWVDATDLCCLRDLIMLMPIPLSMLDYRFWGSPMRKRKPTRLLSRPGWLQRHTVTCKSVYAWRTANQVSMNWRRR